ncbi:MAG: lysylphosphatidylglycerol synthase transmembrane domain-containing protein [Actinomycetota bacterium]
MAAEKPGPPRPRPGWQFWARIFVSVGLLAVLVNKAPDFDDPIPEQHHLLTVALVTGAIAATLIGIVLSAWRWQRVLAALGYEVPLPTLFGHYLAGQFVGNVLPSTIGGDVLRISRLSTTTGSSTTAFASVVLERLTGFVVLPVIVFVGFFTRPALLEVEHSWVALLVAAITLVVLFVLLFLAAHPRIAGRFAEHGNWMRFIGAVHDGVDRLRREPRHALPVLGTALVYQSSVVLSVAFIFRALDLPIPIAGICAYVPAVAMLQVIPLSFNGLGVREGALVFFLDPWPGVSSAQAIAVGVLWFTATLIVSVLGAPSFAVGHRRREHARDAAEPRE